MSSNYAKELELAYNEGYQAYLDGWKRDKCPYNNNDEYGLMCEWLEGYTDACWDD